AGGRDSTYIFLSNRDRMVLPVTLQLRYGDGTTETKTLPVEMWYLGDRFTARFATPKAVTGVVVDPTAVLPDENRANNRWAK
ncbi:MAG: M1 family peptidase, partial [Gemmatimonadota bacterium]